MPGTYLNILLLLSLAIKVRTAAEAMEATCSACACTSLQFMHGLTQLLVGNASFLNHYVRSLLVGTSIKGIPTVHHK